MHLRRSDEVKNLVQTIHLKVIGNQQNTSRQEFRLKREYKSIGVTNSARMPFPRFDEVYNQIQMSKAKVIDNMKNKTLKELGSIEGRSRPIQG
jgi:hypothetical protein